MRLFIFLFSFAIFNLSYSQNETYWDKTEYIFLSVDSAEKQMKIDQENKRIADSTKAAQKEIWKNRERKNIVRCELLGRGVYFGMLYERKINQHKRISSYISGKIGTSFLNRSILSIDAFNLSFHSILFQDLRFAPIVGFGCSMWVVYKPSPATKAEREIIRERGYGDGGQYLPPFRSLPVLMMGIQIKLSKQWNMQLLYTPLFGARMYETLLQAPISTTIKDRLDIGGINIGYKF